jgi:hypothetical protein
MVVFQDIDSEKQSSTLSSAVGINVDNVGG